MRRPVIAANWKMNMLSNEAESFASEFLSCACEFDFQSGEILIFPPFIFGLMTGRICLTYDESVLDDFYFIGAESLEAGKLVSA